MTQPSLEKKSKPNLEALLSSIESRKGFLEYHDIDTEIGNTWKNYSSEKPPLKWLAEIIAFQFMEEHPGEIEGYGDYFGPMMEAVSGDGTPIRIPDVKLVTKKVITYWTDRAKSSKHPVMAARYAGLVYDLSRVVTGQSAPYEIAEIYFKNLLIISKESLQEHEMVIVHKLERALHISISMKNEGWIGKTRKEIIAYQDRINRDDAPGYWAMSYRLLIENKKAQVTIEEQDKIIGGLEKRLSKEESKTMDGNIANPWNIESAAEPLANYYKRINSKENLERVICIWGSAFEKAIESVSGLLASSWLQHIHEVYLKYGFKNKADTISIKLREIGDSIIDDLSEHKVELKVPQDEINNFINAITDKDLETALIRLAIYFIPKIEKVKEHIDSFYSSSPLAYFFSRQIIDDKGRVVAIIGPYETDPTGHIMAQMAREIDIDGIYLHPLWESIIDKFALDTKKLMNFISKSSVLKPERLLIIEKGVAAFFDKDFFVAAHLLIPQIEEGVRNIQELFGGSVLKPRKGGGYHYKTLDDLLREDIVKRVLGENFAFYMQVVLSDPRTWNLRNDICHGLLTSISENRAIRIIHIMLCLSLIRPKEDVQE